MIKFGSAVALVSALASGTRYNRFDPYGRWGKVCCLHTHPFVSFAGMTGVQCTILWIRILTGGPLSKDIHHLCRLKNPTSVI